MKMLPNSIKWIENTKQNFIINGLEEIKKACIDNDEKKSYESFGNMIY